MPSKTNASSIKAAQENPAPRISKKKKKKKKKK
jgi:hypothetical protein